MPKFAHTVQVDVAPAAVFEILDGTSRTPEWLTRCTGIDELDPAPHQVGSRLRYHYRDGRRSGVMEGSIVAREPGRRLTMRYGDRMNDVTVDFVTADGERAGTTALTHTIEVATKGFGKLFTPLISRALPKQTREAMTRLKALAER